MDLGDVIRQRRSIRKYKSMPVRKELLDEILECGLYAPSSGDLQCRHLYVVQDEKTKKDISKVAYDQKFIAQAPVVIVVCADNRIEKEYGDDGKNLYVFLDCAAAIQNILIRSYSLGLGSCWVGAFDAAKVSKIINAPSHFGPVSLVTLGYADESPEPSKRKKTITFINENN